jgi:hypothetical protein
MSQLAKRLQGRQESGNILGFVEDGNDDGKAHAGFLLIRHVL